MIESRDVLIIKLVKTVLMGIQALYAMSVTSKTLLSKMVI